MVTATKNSRELIDEWVAAGTWTSGYQNITTALGGTLTAYIEISSSNDGSASEVLVEISDDGSTWRKFSKIESGTDTNTIYEFVFDIPASVMHIQVTITNNDSSNTIIGKATLQELTSIE